jgi:hypothetical protein
LLGGVGGVGGVLGGVVCSIQKIIVSKHPIKGNFHHTCKSVKIIFNYYEL